MANEDKPDPQEPTYRVGKNKPPHEHDFKPGQSGNVHGRGVYTVIDNRTGEKVPRKSYQLRWLSKVNKQLKEAVALVTPRLIELALQQEDKKAALGAIKEIYVRAMGAPKEHVKVSGQVEHVHSNQIDWLKDLNSRMQQRQIVSAVEDATFEEMKPDTEKKGRAE